MKVFAVYQGIWNNKLSLCGSLVSIDEQTGQLLGELSPEQIHICTLLPNNFRVVGEDAEAQVQPSTEPSLEGVSVEGSASDDNPNENESVPADDAEQDDKPKPVFGLGRTAARGKGK